MGVYIKGMEMPKDGVYWCEIGVADDIAMITIHGEDRKSFPLVPVPPHGRLGDLDEIERYKERLVVDADKIKNGIRYVVDTKYIKEAPTIIPAEEARRRDK